MVHPIIVGYQLGYPGEPERFNHACGKSMGLLFGGDGSRCRLLCLCPLKVFVHLQQEAGAFRDPLILIMPILGFYDVIHADGNIGSPFFRFFFLEVLEKVRSIACKFLKEFLSIAKILVTRVWWEPKKSTLSRPSAREGKVDQLQIPESWSSSQPCN